MSIIATEKNELEILANQIGVKTETEKCASGDKKCYWICNNGFMCDPQDPPPNCNCHKVCI